MKDSFILHHDTLSVIDELTDEQAGQLIKEIYAYSNFLNNPKEAKKPTGLNGLMNSVLHPFKMQLDRDLEKYLKVVERNSKNGKKGGRPPKEETKTNPNKPKKADSDKEKDSDSDSDKEKEIVVIPQTELDAIEVADYLLSKIKTTQPNFKGKSDSWVKDIEKCIRLDKRDMKTLIACINWIYTPQGEFWQSNILSGKKLREKYDTMEIQSKRNKKKVSVTQTIYEKGLTATEVIEQMEREYES